MTNMYISSSQLHGTAKYKLIGIANLTVKPLFLLSVKVQCSQGGASREFLGILTSQKRQRCWPVNPLP